MVFTNFSGRFNHLRVSLRKSQESRRLLIQPRRSLFFHSLHSYQGPYREGFWCQPSKHGTDPPTRLLESLDVNKHRTLYTVFFWQYHALWSIEIPNKAPDLFSPNSLRRKEDFRHSLLKDFSSFLIDALHVVFFEKCKIVKRPLESPLIWYVIETKDLVNRFFVNHKKEIRIEIVSMISNRWMRMYGQPHGSRKSALNSGLIFFWKCLFIDFDTTIDPVKSANNRLRGQIGATLKMLRSKTEHFFTTTSTTSDLHKHPVLSTGFSFFLSAGPTV